MTIKKESRAGSHQATPNTVLKSDFTRPTHSLESPRPPSQDAVALIQTESNCRDIDVVRNALACISSEDRDVWVRMGMAIKSEFGDAGFDLWFVWSQQAASFRDKDARDVWKSIDEKLSNIFF